MSRESVQEPGYVAAHPMPPERIELDSLVYVPMWRAGRVIRWGYGRVIEMTATPTYIVRLSHPPDGTSADALYLPHSMQCGMCVDAPQTAPCPQCRPLDPGTYALSIENGSAIPPDGNEPQFNSVNEALEVFTEYVKNSGAQYSEYFGVCGWLYYAAAWDGISYGDAAEAACRFTIGPDEQIIAEYL